jgi:hypothetical protein
VTDREVEVASQSWEYQLVAAVVYAVEQRAGGPGGPRTRWNGRVLEESDPECLGAAHDDGSLSVSVPEVLVPLRQARDLDRPLTDAEAWRIRDAMDTMTHEAAHLMAPLGDSAEPEAYPYDDAASVDDEGRVENWTKRNVDLIVSDVFADAGLGKIEAVVQAQPNIDAYAAYTPAARHLDRALAGRSGLTSAEVTQKLLCTADSQRWNAEVDLVIDERLAEPGLMPESQRAEVRRQLVAPLRASLSPLAGVEGDDSLGSDQKAAASAAAAQQAVAALDQELNRVERHYRIQHAQLAQQQSQRPASRQSQAVRQAREGRPPGLKKLRALTGAQAPAAGATRQQPAAAGPAPAENTDGARLRGQQAGRPQTGGPQQPPQRG